MEGSPRAPSLVGESDNYELWDAAYVLGSLSEADRRAYEAHLGDCRSCRRSVDQLSGMPALLGQLSVDEVAAIDDRGSDALSPRVLPSLLAKVSRRRRTARLVTWTVAAAAAAVLAIGVLVGMQFHPGGTGFGAVASRGVGADDDAGGAYRVDGHGDDDWLQLGNPNRHELHLPGGTGQLRPRR